MEPWKLVMDEEVFRAFLASKTADRQKILLIFDQLRNDPHRKSDYESKDVSGRSLSILAQRPFLITYWLDVFVSEVRIIDLQRIRY